MKFHDKLFQLRKKGGFTQAELAEKLNVSRQAISKWEMGTAIPDIENMLSLSKLFSVSIDYLVNDEMESELDSPTVKATATISKINYQYIIIRIIVAFCIISIISIIGVVTNSFTSMFFALSLIGILLLIYFVIKLLVVFLSHKN